jgi:L-ascorbate metabolism protein UlaG (beta-lactamase superfamily)
MATEVELISNAGMRVTIPRASILIDAFHGKPSGRAGRRPDDRPADVIMVTHSHWDHFDPAAVAEAAGRTGATVVGPRTVVGRLQGRVPAGKLVEMEPPQAGAGEKARSVRVELPVAEITAFRTFHTRDHTSYLVETPDVRFFHDGDNEDTRRIDTDLLGRLDALLIGPWLGGGWVEFIEELKPTRYFLIHLDDDELRQHDAGEFLPEICDHVPPGLVVLHPGEKYVLD